MSEAKLSLSSQEKLKLASWGLPSSILKKYAEKGVVDMFPWQVDCLCSSGVLSGGNLVYSAPTSAGKTLVAEILAIKTILERKKKVFFILPFVSVVREKMLYFKELLGNCGVHVHGFMGSHVPPGGFKTTNLAVCTIEKANGLINRLVEEHEMEEVGCVIVDELHLLGDPHRGYLLELLLAKIKYVGLREAGVRVQIIGMSATLPNLNLLAGWLDAALYSTCFRPVPLTEYLKIDSFIYNNNDLSRTSLKVPDFDIKDDPGDIIKLCIDTLLHGHSVLVFCPTKNWCEALALQIATEIRKIGCGNSDLGLKLREQLNSNSISDLLEQLKRCPVGLETGIGKCVSFGVAYHHAGLTLDERDILENSFRLCILRVLVATSTLSSGVNLPARRVIVRSPLFGGQPIDILSYKQMIGRAGRMGKDTAGESFLVCKASERRIGETLVNAALPSVESCLGLGNLSSSLKRAVLEVIASGVVTSLSDVEAYTSCTLFAASRGIDQSSNLTEPITACIEFLQTNQFIRVLKDDQIAPTNLGEACLSAALPPDQALRLLSELHRARQCFVLDSELHVIYQVTPFSVSEQWRQLDWMSALNLWENLSPSMQRVGELVGVEERFLVRAIRGNINTNSSAQMEKLSLFRRFYTALALQDLVNEVPLVHVAEKYKCSKGMLQSLQQSASTFAGMVTQFCRRLGWSSLELLVSQFAERLQFGVQRELIDLLRIDCLSAIHARALFNSNIQSLSQLATAKVENVEKALRKAVPFESEKESVNGEVGSRKCIWLAGRKSLTEREAATLIISEARDFIKAELGLKTVEWENNSSSFNENENYQVSLNSLKESSSNSNSTKVSGEASLFSVSKEIHSDIDSSNVKKIETNNSCVSDNVVVNRNELVCKVPSEIEIVDNDHKNLDKIKNDGNFLTDSSSTQNKNALVKTRNELIIVGQNECNNTMQISDYSTDMVKLKEENKSNVKGLSELIIDNVSKLECDIISSRFVTNENDSVIKSSSEVIYDNNIENSDSEKLEKSHDTNGKLILHRNSLDMFDESGNSSSEEENDTKFKDVICSLSLYDSKVSKIYNNDSSGDELSEENKCTKRLIQDNKADDLKITNRNEKENNIVKNFDDLKKDSLCLNAKENMLLDFNTQFENMLNSVCLRNWDSIDINDDITLKKGIKGIDKSDVNKIKTGDGEEVDTNFEDDTEILLRTPMIKTKSILDYMNKSCLRGVSKLTETSMNDEFTSKSEKSIIYGDCFTNKRANLVTGRTSPENLGPVEIQRNRILSDGKSQTVTRNSDSSFHEHSPIIVASKNEFKHFISLGKLRSGQIVVPNSENIILHHIKFSTPVNSPVANNDSTVHSSLDLFENSPSSNYNNNQLDSALTCTSLDDMDINWGGESILQSSMLLLETEEQKHIHSLVSEGAKKRKRSSTEDVPVSLKKMKLCSNNVEHESIYQNNVLIVADFGNTNSKRKFKGKNVINSCNSVKRLSVDKNSELRLGFSVQKNGFYESLSIDSQMCNILDDVNKFNNNNNNNKSVLNVNGYRNFGMNVAKSDSEEITKDKKSVCNVHDIIRNSSVTITDNCEEAYISNLYNNNDRKNIDQFKVPVISSNLEKGRNEDKLLNKSKMLNGSLLKNDVTKRNANVPDFPEESSINEFKVTDSILETAAAFQSVIDFKDEIYKVCPEENENFIHQPSVKLADKKNDDKRNESSQRREETRNFTLSGKSNNVKDNGSCKTTVSYSEKLAIDKIDFKRITSEVNRSIEDGINCKLDYTGDFIDDCDDLITSSQEEPPVSTTRVHTRSMLSQCVKESSQHKSSSVKNPCSVFAENVCSNEHKLELFRKNLSRRKVVSVALDVVKKGENLKDGIGARILARKCSQHEKEGDFSFGSSIIKGIAVYWGFTNIYYLDMQKSDCICLPTIREIFLNHNITILMFDLKNRIKLLRRCCTFLTNCKGSDPVIADWILSPSDRRKSLRQMLKMNNVKCPVIDDDRNVIREAVEVWHLNSYFQNKLKQLLVISSYKEIEMPIQFCLSNMEIAGFGFDKDYAELLWDRVEIKIAELLEVVYETVGRKFNPRSKADLNKIQKFLASTIGDNCQELEMLSTLMKKWRQLNSLKTRNLSPILLEMGSRLYGDCITTTQTGRVSMHEPNLQNIPKDIIVDEEVFSMRTAFIPAPGFVLVSADYCQLELRILGHFSEDKALLEAFHSSSDIFISIAATWHKVPESQVTAELRHHTKQICYGLIYGMGVSSLSEQMQLSEHEAKNMMESFKAAYPTLQEYLANCIFQCRKTKEVRTLFNRVRFLPDINNSNSTQRSQAERQAVNTTIQGSAADIAKIGMLKVESSLKKHCPDANLVLQLHDELIYEVLHSDFDAAVKIIKREMENACQLKVPLPVKVKAGPSWGQLEVLNTECTG